MDQVIARSGRYGCWYGWYRTGGQWRTTAGAFPSETRALEAALEASEGRAPEIRVFDADGVETWSGTFADFAATTDAEVVAAVRALAPGRIHTHSPGGRPIAKYTKLRPLAVAAEILRRG